jgi:hypothetical protein
MPRAIGGHIIFVIQCLFLLPSCTQSWYTHSPHPSCEEKATEEAPIAEAAIAAERAGGDDEEEDLREMCCLLRHVITAIVQVVSRGHPPCTPAQPSPARPCLATAAQCNTQKSKTDWYR